MGKIPEVAILGAGMTECRSRHIGKSYIKLAQESIIKVLKDSGIRIGEIEAAFIGMYNDLFQDKFICDSILGGTCGFMNKPAWRVTKGGATGIYTMIAAYHAIASELYDLVLVTGVEKCLDPFDFVAQNNTPAVVQTIGFSWDPWFDRPLGDHASNSYAEVIRAYMDVHPGDVNMECRAKLIELLCVQAHNNPYAQRRDEEVTAQEVMHSRYTVWPLRSMETCVYSEGACSLIFGSKKAAQIYKERTGQEPIWIVGTGAADESWIVGSDISTYKVPHRIYSDYLSAKTARETAGGLNPYDIKVYEVHDAFMPQAMITLAEMGLTSLGRANDLVNEGIVMPGGKILFNPSGGLTFGGHFVGGSNMMSAWSVMRELRARDLEFGLVHGTGAERAIFGGAMILQRKK